jgi:hypothetical protein
VSAKEKGTRLCPDCGERSYADNWMPPEGLDPSMRRFICSECGTEFYVVIDDQELLGYFDKMFGRK